MTQTYEFSANNERNPIIERVYKFRLIYSVLAKRYKRFNKKLAKESQFKNPFFFFFFLVDFYLSKYDILYNLMIIDRHSKNMAAYRYTDTQRFFFYNPLVTKDKTKC